MVYLLASIFLIYSHITMLTITRSGVTPVHIAFTVCIFDGFTPGLNIAEPNDVCQFQSRLTILHGFIVNE